VCSLREYVAPTGLDIFRVVVSTKMSRLRRWAAALLEPASWCCYASKRFMLWTPTKKFLEDDGKWIRENIFAALKNKTVAKAA
jgi:hypothetical protein